MATSNEFEIKTRLVEVTDKKTGVKYIEERTYRYDPVKKYNIQLSSHRTGRKIMPDGTEVNCRPKKRSTGSKEPPVSATRNRVGATDLLNYIGKLFKIDSSVANAYPNGGTAQKLLSVAQYLVITGEPVHKIDSWQVNHTVPYEEGLSEDICYKLFEELGLNESGMQSLFQEFSHIAGKERQQGIAFDSTSHSSYSKGCKPFTCQGFNKDGDGLDIYKVLSFFSLDSGLPISFELQKGNIPDMSSLLNAIKRAKSYGLHNPELVFDNGFFSKKNICLLLRNNIKFTVLGTLTDKWVLTHFDDETDEQGISLRQTINNYSNRCPFDSEVYGLTRSAMTNFTWERQKKRGDKQVGDIEQHEYRLYYHYFKNERLAADQRKTLHDTLSKIEEALNYGFDLTDAQQNIANECFTVTRNKYGKINVTPNNEAINEREKNLGLFVLITNKNKTAWEALKTYRQRNDIEESYRIIKTSLDGKRTREWSPEHSRGKEVCRHVALAYKFGLLRVLKWAQEEAERRKDDTASYKASERNLYEKLSKWLKQNSSEQVLAWFDCIEDVTVKNKRSEHRWSSESTRRDQLFLQLLDEKTDWV